MPNNKVQPQIPVISAKDYPLDAKSIARLQKFLGQAGVKTRPSSVVVIRPDQFEAARRAVGTPAQTRTAFTVGDRIYLNGATLFPSTDSEQIAKDLGVANNDHLAEYALSHELAHMNDTRPRAWQEAHDSIFNQQGHKIYSDWLQSLEPPKVAPKPYAAPTSSNDPAERLSMAGLRTLKDAQTIEPIRASIATELVPPDSEPHPHPHPVLKQAGGLVGDHPSVLLDKLTNHISDMPGPDRAKVGSKFGLTPQDTFETASAKMHQALGSEPPVAA